MKKSVLKKAVLVLATTLSFACSAAASEGSDMRRMRREVASAELISGEMPGSRATPSSMHCALNRDADAESGDTLEVTSPTPTRVGVLR